MGKAAVELADPPPGAGADSGNVDDLLSQMAGDEIDRLLAEADVEPASAIAASTAALPAAAVADPVIPAPAAADAQASAHSNDMLDSADLSPQLDALFEQLSAQNESSESAAGANAGAAPVATAIARIAAPADAAAIDSAASTPSAATAPSAESATPIATAAPTDAASSEPAAPPHAASQAPTTVAAALVEQLLNVLLLPLQMLNEPLENCSDSLRQGLGWIGIVTTINALAVIAYVVMFRRH